MTLDPLKVTTRFLSSQLECPVCADDEIEPENAVVYQPCGHVFCTGCHEIMQRQAYKDKCSSCKQIVRLFIPFNTFCLNCSMLITCDQATYDRTKSTLYDKDTLSCLEYIRTASIQEHAAIMDMVNNPNNAIFRAGPAAFKKYIQEKSTERDKAVVSKSIVASILKQLIRSEDHCSVEILHHVLTFINNTNDDCLKKVYDLVAAQNSINLLIILSYINQERDIDELIPLLTSFIKPADQALARSLPLVLDEICNGMASLPSVNICEFRVILLGFLHNPERDRNYARLFFTHFYHNQFHGVRDERWPIFRDNHSLSLALTPHNAHQEVETSSFSSFSDSLAHSLECIGEEYDVFGKLVYEGHYYNKKFHGRGSQCIEGKCYEGNFAFGKMNGLIQVKHLDGGMIESEYTYVKGIREGPYKIFNRGTEGGDFLQVQQKGMMKNGKKCGAFEEYKIDGSFLKRGVYDENGKETDVEVYLSPHFSRLPLPKGGILYSYYDNQDYRIDELTQYWDMGTPRGFFLDINDPLVPFTGEHTFIYCSPIILALMAKAAEAYIRESSKKLMVTPVINGRIPFKDCYSYRAMTKSLTLYNDSCSTDINLSQVKWLIQLCRAAHSLYFYKMNLLQFGEQLDLHWGYSTIHFVECNIQKIVVDRRFEYLRHLYIRRCMGFQEFSMNQVPKLKSFLISYCDQLKTVRVGENCALDMHDKLQFHNLRSLNELSFGDYAFSNCSCVSIDNLQNLEIIKMGTNFARNTSAFFISKCGKLKRIAFGDNCFVAGTEMGIANCEELETVKIGQNCFHDRGFRMLFKNLMKLREFTFQSPLLNESKCIIKNAGSVENQIQKWAMGKK